jgi:hypothetical protein
LTTFFICSKRLEIADRTSGDARLRASPPMLRTLFGIVNLDVRPRRHAPMRATAAARLPPRSRMMRFDEILRKFFPRLAGRDPALRRGCAGDVRNCQDFAEIFRRGAAWDVLTAC